MKLKDYVHFNPPTIYDIIMTVGILVVLISLWFVRISQAQTHDSQVEMQKNYITKDYLYNFYITVDQIKAIEKERPAYMKRIATGEPYDKVNEDFINFVERITALRTRGL